MACVNSVNSVNSVHICFSFSPGVTISWALNLALLERAIYSLKCRLNPRMYRAKKVQGRIKVCPGLFIYKQMTGPTHPL